ncbi:MAG: hypothetical protein AAFX85_09290 [Pseudomonadota bacterium]
MKNCVAALAATVLAAFSASSVAQTVTVYHADGSATEREATVLQVTDAQALGPWLWSQPSRGADVTLNTSVDMRDPTTNESIDAAAPGQEVDISTFFNRLDSLEVPLEDLVGRVFVTAIIAPTLGIQTVLQIPVEPDDGNVVCYGIRTTISNGAPLGPFPLIGANRIPGVATADDTARILRRIEAAGAPR